VTTRHETELARRVEAEALACIGCNDCLLACPVPESRSVTIGELNFAIHLPVITQNNVIEFVTACTQCRQCVPACPADLNRAEMVLFNKLKVEDSVPDHELMLQARTVAFPSGFRLDGLAHKLTELLLFHGVPAQALRRLILKSTLRLLVPGEELCKEGEFYERLCVVLSGSLEQTAAGPRGEALHILMLGPGTFFGEMGVLGAVPEPFSATAVERSIVLETPKVGVERLMELSPPFRETLESLYARRTLWTYARNPTALGALPEAATEELLRDATLELLSSGQTLFQQSDPPRDLFLVRSGFLRASQLDAGGERVLTYFREGSLFGLLALLGREPIHGYTVLAASRAEVIRISGAALGRVLGRYPAAHDALARGAFEAEGLARARDIGVRPFNPELSIGARPSSAESVLVEGGLATGREILVVDQSRCTGCNNCVEACARRHGKSRLELRGLMIDEYLFPTACRHCDDPACLMCSVSGIVRLPSGEIKIVEESCIGCGACAERCPYGNISMHPAHAPERGLLFRLLDFLAGGPARDAALEALDPKTARVAVKCDLCAGYADYACVTACPVGAAFRIDPAAALAAAPRGP
jgi:CRP-like cAMP-binding protein/Fe-S-cluster-containing hydrogenase component 2